MKLTPSEEQTLRAFADAKASLSKSDNEAATASFQVNVQGYGAVLVTVLLLRARWAFPSHEPQLDKPPTAG